MLNLKRVPFFDWTLPFYLAGGRARDFLPFVAGYVFGRGIAVFDYILYAYFDAVCYVHFWECEGMSQVVSVK